MIPFYWKVGDQLYYNDVAALKAATASDLPLEFKVTNVNAGPHWASEPPLPVHEYIDKVTRHIASTYDNITLLYSGGTDSHTMLESFIRCGVRNVHLYMDVTEEHIQDSERMLINKWTTDTLKSKYKFIFTELGYTFNDHKDTDNRWRALTKDEMEATLHSYTGSWHTSMAPAHGSSRYPSSLKKPEDKKTAIVWGFEKPHIIIKDGWFCWTVDDRVAHYRDMGENSNCDNYFFFYSPTVPELQVKLAWLKIKALTKIMNELRLPFVNDSLEILQSVNIAYKFYKRINEECGYKAINEILNSTMSKDSPIKSKSNQNVKRYSIENGNQEIIDSFQKSVVNSVDDIYLINNGTSFKGVRANPIKIKKV